ncbi:MAG TPA: Trk system potassium transporter TrkA [Dissulfurispiraceae bacterium]|nr:Trk system potassium transporter TrkA [Dissulfurispiraceae bacterium]
MHVIIVGAGEVGYQIAKFLSFESKDVVVIDRDRTKLRRISEELDVAVIEGEGGSLSVLNAADAETADMLLAVTDSDEANMIACVLAKAMFNIPRKIARIRNPEYFANEKLLSRDNLDIDPAINPELEVARAIIRLLEVPFATEVEDFEQGSVKVVGLKVPKDAPIAGKPLTDLKKTAGKRMLVGIIEREDRTIIPSGSDVIREGDIIYVPVKRDDVNDTLRLIGASAKPLKRVMLLGGGRVGFHVASAMETHVDLKIVDTDHERCKYLSKNLRKALVLQGDGADQKLLREENIGDMDVFAAVTNNDELNIMASLLAKKLGVEKTIAIVNRTDYSYLAHSLGLQAVLSPRLITASTILQYVRRGDILSLTAIAEDKAEIIQARVGTSSRLIGKILKDAKLPRHSLVGTIIRDGEIIIPSGLNEVRENDRLIFFALREAVKEIERLLS